MPLITVLLPAYNVAGYIGASIQSILDQDFRDFELLIVNDGSTDDTLGAIRRFQDPRIRVLDLQPNRGLIEALNTGIAEAAAPLIARMDGDDSCRPGRLSLQYDYMQQNPDCVALGSAALFTDKENNPLLHLDPPGFTHAEISATIADKCPFIHPAVIFRKDAVLAAGGYPKDALTFEDHLLWKKLLGLGRLHNLREELLVCRFNPESVTVDEKWRGPAFIRIRRESVARGYVSEADAAELKTLIAGQNFSRYKTASYHNLVAKKYLFNRPDSRKARQHLRDSLRIYHKPESYLLYLFSFLPAALRKTIYQTLKTNG